MGGAGKYSLLFINSAIDLAKLTSTKINKKQQEEEISV